MLGENKTLTCILLVHPVNHYLLLYQHLFNMFTLQSLTYGSTNQHVWTAQNKRKYNTALSDPSPCKATLPVTQEFNSQETCPQN